MKNLLLMFSSILAIFIFTTIEIQAQAALQVFNSTNCNIYVNAFSAETTTCNNCSTATSYLVPAGGTVSIPGCYANNGEWLAILYNTCPFGPLCIPATSDNPSAVCAPSGLPGGGAALCNGAAVTPTWALSGLAVYF